MIRICKDVQVPLKLTQRGEQYTQELCDLYEENSQAYKNKTLKLPDADSNVYGHKSVKKALLKCQHHKCCFSEAKFVGDYGDVEHFRPKGCVVDGKQRLYPGYYWLTYKWENLFVCKELINRSHKKNYFPLQDEKNRARSHRDNIEAEEPLLIDPARENPRDHIRFHEDEPVAHRGSQKGRTTIKLLRLDHPDFAEARRSHLKKVREFRNILDTEANDEDVRQFQVKAKEVLDGWTKPDAEFSSMTIDYLEAHPIPD